jgi:hypothetical protein
MVLEGMLAHPKVPTGDIYYSFPKAPTARATASSALPVGANDALRLTRVPFVPPRSIRDVSGASPGGKWCIEPPSFLRSCWLGRSPNGELVLDMPCPSVRTVFRRDGGRGCRSGSSAIPRAL